MRSSRAFHAYCIGTSKSGTHSIAGLFQPQYRAAHEPEHYDFIQLLLSTQNSALDQTQYPKGTLLKAQLNKRDQRLDLELESSNLFSFFVESLVETFPEAKFILTMRDCYSWLDSTINHQLNAGYSADRAFWWGYRDFCFRFPSPSIGRGVRGEGRSEPFEHRAEEALLAQHQLYTLDGYLSYWQRINQKSLTTIPPERLLLVRTVEIGQSLDKIAQFLHIPVETLNASHSHLYKAKKKFNLLRQIDRDFLEQKVAFYCQALMSQYFPAIRNLDDALGN